MTMVYILRSVKKEKQLHKFGIEKTFVYPTWGQEKSAVEAKVDRIFAHVTDEMHTMLGDCKLINSIGFDPGCVEVSSAPITTMSEAEQFFNMTSEIALKHKLKHVTPHVLGCGGHIHVERPRDANHSRAMINFARCNPWMNAFGHPGDDMNLRSPGLSMLIEITQNIRWARKSRCYFQDAYRISDQRTASGMPVTPIDTSLVSLLGKLDFIAADVHRDDASNSMDWETNQMIEVMKPNYHAESHGGQTLTPRGYRGTLEFRCFDGVTGWDEQVAHIEFAQAVVRYSKDNASALAVSPCMAEMNEMFWLKYDDQAAGFENMIAHLDLDWGVYKKYLPRLKKRIKMEQMDMRRRLKKVSLKI